MHIYVIFLLLASLSVFCLHSAQGDFKLHSEIFADFGKIPARYTCDGEDISPSFEWEGEPKGTKSFALICRDPDAPSGTFIHWIIYNIPSQVHKLEQSIVKEETLKNGEMQGINDFGRVGYGGPCPPKGKPHHYIFTLYALDDTLKCSPKCSIDEIEKAMHDHILSQSQWTGIYERGATPVREAAPNPSRPL